MDRSLKAAGRSFPNKKKVIKNKKKDYLKTTDSTK
jgi:hypothetical protein